MKEVYTLPESVRPIVAKFYDELCSVLTDWEQGEISDYELYSYMVDVASKIPHISYICKEV